MNKEFSKKDLEILYELSVNSRIPLNKLAKRLKLSSQGLSYRIEKLTKEKVFTNYYTLFDYSCFGYSGFKVFFNISSTNIEDLKHFTNSLLSHQNVISLTKCGGKWDLSATFASKNASKFNKELKILISQHPKLIRTYLILTNVSSFELGRRYLLEYSPPLGIKVIGGDRDLIKIDLIDQKIIQELHRNPKITYVYLSSKFNMNPKTIVNKIKSLETKGIIKGFTNNLDCSKLGFVSHKILIKYYNPTIEKEDEMLKYIRQNKNVIKISKVLGEFDLEIDVENININQFNNFCFEIRSHFGLNIQNFEFLPLSERLKLSYLPESFFSEVF